MNRDRPKVVIHRGRVLGSAANERGALNVAARHLSRSAREHYTARRADHWEDTGTDFVHHGEAWHVGVSLS